MLGLNLTVVAQASSYEPMALMRARPVATRRHIWGIRGIRGLKTHGYMWDVARRHFEGSMLGLNLTVVAQASPKVRADGLDESLAASQSDRSYLAVGFNPRSTRKNKLRRVATAQ